MGTVRPLDYMDMSPGNRAPEETLSKLVEDRLGFTVDPDALRKFILNDWRRVSTLAHAIHDKGIASYRGGGGDA